MAMLKKSSQSRNQRSVAVSRKNPPRHKNDKLSKNEMMLMKVTNMKKHEIIQTKTAFFAIWPNYRVIDPFREVWEGPLEACHAHMNLCPIRPILEDSKNVFRSFLPHE